MLAYALLYKLKLRKRLAGGIHLSVDSFVLFFLGGVMKYLTEKRER